MELTEYLADFRNRQNSDNYELFEETAEGGVSIECSQLFGKDYGSADARVSYVEIRSTQEGSVWSSSWKKGSVKL